MQIAILTVSSAALVCSAGSLLVLLKMAKEMQTAKNKVETEIETIKTKVSHNAKVVKTALDNLEI